MSVDIKAGATLESGTPKPLFQTKINVNSNIDQYAPTGDGQRFLLIDAAEQTGLRAIPITVVLDWTAGIPAR